VEIAGHSRERRQKQVAEAVAFEAMAALKAILEQA